MWMSTALLLIFHSKVNGKNLTIIWSKHGIVDDQRRYKKQVKVKNVWISLSHDPSFETQRARAEDSQLISLDNVYGTIWNKEIQWDINMSSTPHMQVPWPQLVLTSALKGRGKHVRRMAKMLGHMGANCWEIKEKWKKQNSFLKPDPVKNEKIVLIIPEATCIY